MGIPSERLDYTIRAILPRVRAIIYIALSIVLSIKLIRHILPDPPYEWRPEPSPLCATELYTVRNGDTCNSISVMHKIPSHGLWEGNKNTIPWCNVIQPGMVLCLPPSCDVVHQLQPGDTCESIEIDHADVLNGATFLSLNPWLQNYQDCEKLHLNPELAGTVYCLGIQGGYFGSPQNAWNPVSLKNMKTGERGRYGLSPRGNAFGLDPCVAHALKKSVAVANGPPNFGSGPMLKGTISPASNRTDFWHSH
ncbi:hypothetical protein P175DRAFT_0558571 [Aspergillus ochraceoroseus IBT 24754]|uniref:LysM domain-containing protein n=1 Tax=Aspergillus ochraceoroseus IBT 24754 TaxID=1392256 RepID=A0A2T5LVS3_9EURO|nr:uncharacterized protein P175DRAFT_0558571 [Aspergillus ochraceoroseus IBT 24754]PTU20387.1 hypothetical protein P175DRAFT_0558571 [Aspergillus ochraceoroseus IBT 24754]